MPFEGQHLQQSKMAFERMAGSIFFATHNCLASNIFYAINHALMVVCLYSVFYKIFILFSINRSSIKVTLNYNRKLKHKNHLGKVEMISLIF